MNMMAEQIKSLPSLIEEQMRKLDTNIRDQFSHNDLLSTKRIVIAGCGDSYFAGLATKHFFKNVCGVPTLAQEAMEASLYELVYRKTDFPSPKNPLVITISNSGSSARTLEAALAAKNIGSWTVGLTSNEDSKLAKACDNVINIHAPNIAENQGPGFRSYYMSLMGLYLFGIHLAEVRGTMTMQESAEYRKKLKGTAAQIEEVLKTNDDIAKELAEKYKDEKYFVFLGDGPNYGSAEFNAAKIIESTGRSAKALYTEEWAHTEYFQSTFPNSPTFITPSSRGFVRSIELLTTMKKVGRQVVVVAEKGNQDIEKLADYVLPMVSDVNPYFAPMVDVVAPGLFAAYLADAAGLTFFRRDNEAYQNDRATKDSQIIQ